MAWIWAAWEQSGQGPRTFPYGGRRTSGATHLGEGIEGMPVLAVERPGHLLAQVLEPQVVHVGDVAEDGVDGFRLVVALFAFDHVVRGDATFGKVDVP